MRTSISFRCDRCGFNRFLPDDGRVWMHAMKHVTGLCVQTEIGTWSAADYRAGEADGLPEIDLYGRPWIRTERVAWRPRT